LTERIAEYGSDLIADVLRDLGIKYAALNPGASIRGIHDSVVNYEGNQNPELILCCHEEIAVAIASGYFRASGKPMAVLVHDLEGLLHATKAVFDASLERDAIMILGGNGPMDVTKRRAGIDWIHTALVPSLVVRDYVKWDDQPMGLTSFIEALIRAYTISISEPQGPVYLSMDAALQEDKLGESISLPRVDSYSTLSIGEGDLASLERMAGSLVEAENPVIIADKYGRDDDSVAALVSLAETLAIPVLDTGLRFNFPSKHPMNHSGLNEEALTRADVVLALDTMDLHHSLTKEEGGHFARLAKYMTQPGCAIFRIDMESVAINSWVSEYGRLAPTDITLAAHAPTAVKKLIELCQKKLDGSRRNAIAERASSAAEKTKQQRKKWLEKAKSEQGQTPLALSALALTVWNAVLNYDWVLAYPGYTASGVNSWIRRIWDINRHYQYPGRGGGTGTGIGRAIGAALANKGKLCIDFQPDGDLLYTPSSLWTASHYRIPLLVFVLDNRSYFNDEEHQRAIALERKRSVENRTVAIRIEDPYVVFEDLASSFGIGSSGLVENITELEQAIDKGIKVVLDEKRPFLVDVHVQSRRD
jgi:acetolactate synthase-1/2/3 large subunit